MKWVVGFLLAAGQAALASDSELTPEEIGGYCTSVAELSAMIMDRRQNGVPITQMMAILESLDDEGLHEVLDQTIMLAYQSPQWPTEESKSSAVIEFQNKAYLSCRRSFSD